MDTFTGAGIGRERVRLLSWAASIHEHLALYNTIDIALDTFPYHGVTTTCEALWMGVPVITLAGPAYSSRGGVGILSSAGHSELIAGTPDEYIALAAALANDAERLQKMRRNLRKEMTDLPCVMQGGSLFVWKTVTGMWKGWCNSP